MLCTDKEGELTLQSYVASPETVLLPCMERAEVLGDFELKTDPIILVGMKEQIWMEKEHHRQALQRGRPGRRKQVSGLRESRPQETKWASSGARPFVRSSMVSFSPHRL
jgi:hypothetical protein